MRFLSLSSFMYVISTSREQILVRIEFPHLATSISFYYRLRCIKIDGSVCADNAKMFFSKETDTSTLFDENSSPS